MAEQKVKCPICSWNPSADEHWHCLQCGNDIDHFKSVGRCNQCQYTHELTYCPEEKGGCGQSTPHLDWYGSFNEGLSKINIFNN
jgi:hypothetical protein